MCVCGAKENIFSSSPLQAVGDKVVPSKKAREVEDITTFLSTTCKGELEWPFNLCADAFVNAMV